jgi:hypothetical protein
MSNPEARIVTMASLGEENYLIINMPLLVEYIPEFSSTKSQTRITDSPSSVSLEIKEKHDDQTRLLSSPSNKSSLTLFPF